MERIRGLDRAVAHEEDDEPVCLDCVNVEVSQTYISVKGNPIMGSCPFRKYMFLLSEQICEDFKSK